MTRWTNDFENHGFQSVWRNLLDLASKIELPDQTIRTDLEELARLKKVIKYVAELLEAADPELIPFSIWGSFHDQANQCLSQIQSYQANKNIGHLNNANNNLDNLLSYVRPYVVSPKSAAQAAIQAFKVYSETINEQISILKTNAKTALDATVSHKTEAADLLKEIQQTKEKFDELEVSLLLGDENEDSLEDRVKDLFTESKGWHEQISAFHKRLTSGNEQESAISLQIEEAKGKAIKSSQAAAAALKDASGVLEELNDFYEKIYGVEDDDGKLKGGLDQEIKTKISALDEFKAEQTNVHAAKLKEIESLLPGATSAGLASAYRELKDSFNPTIKTYTGIFYGSLAGLFLCAFVLITKKIGWDGIEWVDPTSDVAKVLGDIAFKLPFVLPLLWLALFSSKRRSEDRRLQQEYAHKEAIAKSYHSFKSQIEQLAQKDEELSKQLLGSAISAIAFNASSTLDKRHGDKLPFHEAIDSINPLKKK